MHLELETPTPHIGGGAHASRADAGLSPILEEFAVRLQTLVRRGGSVFATSGRCRAGFCEVRDLSQLGA